MNRRTLIFGAVVVATAGCIPLPPGVRAPTEIWAIWSSTSQPVRAADGFSAVAETWIVLDTVSFRPTFISPESRGAATVDQSPGRLSSTRTAQRLAVITSFQGSRYHPDVIRGLTEAGDAVAVTAGSIASLVSSSAAQGVILDFQEMTAEDLQTLMDVSRAIADSSRAHSAATVTLMIPAASSGYPARILARVADLLLVKLFPEHGVTTPAGPIVSPDWFTRRLGQRASEAGVNRVVAGIPADGVLWSNRGGARRISFSEAVRLVREAHTSLVRDPASGNLHAVSNRDGWEIWLADHQLIEKLIDEGRRIGVTRFALFGLEGADPELFR